MTDWSQFTPIDQPAPKAAPVDWSQFHPLSDREVPFALADEQWRATHSAGGPIVQAFKDIYNPTHFTAVNNPIVGGGEEILHLLTGAGAGLLGGLQTAGTLAQKGEKALGLPDILFHGAQPTFNPESIIYEPRTEIGKSFESIPATAGRALAEGSRALGERNYEATGSPLEATIAGTLPQALALLAGGVGGRAIERPAINLDEVNAAINGMRGTPTRGAMVPVSEPPVAPAGALEAPAPVMPVTPEGVAITPQQVKAGMLQARQHPGFAKTAEPVTPPKPKALPAPQQEPIVVNTAGEAGTPTQFIQRAEELGLSPDVARAVHAHQLREGVAPEPPPEPPATPPAPPSAPDLSGAFNKRREELNHEEARHVAYTDHLTGLPNRRAFDEADSPAVAIIDLDGLKYINDTYGHEAGDNHFRVVSQALKEAAPGSVYRIGGDEFAIRAATPAEAGRAAQAARDAVMQQTGVGFSFGVGKTPKQADKAMYGDKRARERLGLRTPRPAGTPPEGPERRQNRAAPKDTRVVHPERDSLMTALAKLGGVSSKEAKAQGIDPADLKHRGFRIHRTFTKNGMTFDEAAERLAEEGYPVLDEQGHYSPNVLLERIDEELRGTPSYGGGDRTAHFEDLAREHEERSAAVPRAPTEDEIAAHFAEAPSPEPEDLPQPAFADYNDYGLADTPGARSLEDLRVLAEDVDPVAAQDARENTHPQQEARELLAIIQRNEHAVHRGRPPEGGRERETPESGGPLAAEAPQANAAGNRRAPREEQQADLIGGATAAQQSLHAEKLRRDRERNSGQESVETGNPEDLFSQARQQTDIEDVSGKPNKPLFSRPSDVQTSSPAFKRWFGDSKVVDTNGKPLVVYHETAKANEPAILERGFSTNPELARARVSDEQVPNGIFFKPHDRRIGLGAIEDADTTQIPVYLSIKNPLLVADRDDLAFRMRMLSKDYGEAEKVHKAIDARYEPKFDRAFKNDDDEAMDHILADWIAAGKESATKMRGLVDEVLSREGYDGVIIHNDRGSMGRSTKTYIALKPEQIKSATGNTGEFSPNNPSILHSRGEGGGSPEAVRNELAESPNTDDFAQLEADGRLRIEDHPDADWAGRWDGKTAVLNAAKIGKGEGVAKAMHELGVHANLAQMVGADSWKRIVADLEAVAKESSRAGDIVRRAKKRVEAVGTPERQYEQELVAYTVEEAVKEGKTWKQTGRLNSALVRLFNRIRAWFKNSRLGRWLKDHGVDVKLKPDDIAAMAAESVHDFAREAEEPSTAIEPLYSRVPDDFDDMARKAKVTPRDEFKRRFTSVNTAWHKWFPDVKSDENEFASHLIVREVARRGQEEASSAPAYERERKLFAKLGVPAQLRFIDMMETGGMSNVPELAQHYARLLAKWHQEERDAGVSEAFLEHYFPHYFHDPGAVKEWMQKNFVKGGKAGFQKQRTFKTYREAIEHGFKPRSTNPADLIQMRWIDHERIMTRHRTLRSLEKYNLIYREEVPGTLKFTTADFGTYYIPEGLANLLNNSLFKESLWTDKSLVGSVFRGIMEAKQLMIPIKLGFSLFHLLHVGIGVKSAHGMAESARLLVDKPITVESAARAAKSFALQLSTAGETLPGTLNSIRKAWEGKKKPTADEAMMIGYMIDGGFRFKNPVEYRSNAIRNLRHAWQDKRVAAFGIHALPAALRTISVPIMDVAVPAMKLQAYIDGVKRLLAEKPELIDDDKVRITALSRLRKNVDERFGEMGYDTLFWNRRLLEVMQGTFLSFTWNYGFWKQFGGGALDMARLVRKALPGAKARRYVDSRAAYATLYTALTMFLGGLMTYAFTGEPPKTVKDLIYPRVGTDEDGEPERVNTMFFTREYGALFYHFQADGVNGLLDTALYKASPMFETLAEQLTNKNFYDQQIYDPYAPIPTRLKQRATALFESIAPISLGSPGESGQTSKKDLYLSLAGFNPAPSYVSRPSIVSKIYSLFGEFSGTVKTYQQAQQIEARRQLRALHEAGKEAAFEQQLEKDIEKFQWSRQSVRNLYKGFYEPEGAYEFSQLPPHVQAHLLDEMTDAERVRYSAYVSKRTRALEASGG